MSFFSLVMFTSMSSAREFSPTIMPSYTSVPGSVNSTPRSWRFVIANGGDRARAVGDQRTVVTGAQLAEPRLVALVDGVRDARAAGLGQELGTEADEAAGRDDELHADPAGAVVRSWSPCGPCGRPSSCVIAPRCSSGDVDRHALDRLVHLAVDLLGDDLRLADGQLEALTAHLLDQDGQRQLTAALDLPGVRALGVAARAARRYRPARGRDGP